MNISKRLYIKTRGPNCKLLGLLGHPNTQNYTINYYTILLLYPEWPHRQGGCLSYCGCTFESR